MIMTKARENQWARFHHKAKISMNTPAGSDLSRATHNRPPAVLDMNPCCGRHLLVWWWLHDKRERIGRTRNKGSSSNNTPGSQACRHTHTPPPVVRDVNSFSGRYLLVLTSRQTVQRASTAARQTLTHVLPSQHTLTHAFLSRLSRAPEAVTHF